MSGNEKADQLAKQATKTHARDNREIDLKRQLSINKVNIYNRNKTETEADLKNKKYANVSELYPQIQNKQRKEATALFRIYVGHDLLNEHLHKIGIQNSPKCTLCDAPSMNSDHLMICPALDPTLRATRNITAGRH